MLFRSGTLIVVVWVYTADVAVVNLTVVVAAVERAMPEVVVGIGVEAVVGGPGVGEGVECSVERLGLGGVVVAVIGMTAAGVVSTLAAVVVMGCTATGGLMPKHKQ